MKQQFGFNDFERVLSFEGFSSNKHLTKRKSKLNQDQGLTRLDFAVRVSGLKIGVSSIGRHIKHQICCLGMLEQKIKIYETQELLAYQEAGLNRQTKQNGLFKGGRN